MVASVALLSVTETVFSLVFRLSLLFYDCFYTCGIAAGDLHDHFAVLILIVVGIFKPVLCHDNGTVGTDIKAHPPSAIIPVTLSVPYSPSVPMEIREPTLML